MKTLYLIFKIGALLSLLASVVMLIYSFVTKDFALIYLSALILFMSVGTNWIVYKTEMYDKDSK